MIAKIESKFFAYGLKPGWYYRVKGTEKWLPFNLVGPGPEGEETARTLEEFEQHQPAAYRTPLAGVQAWW